MRECPNKKVPVSRRDRQLLRVREVTTKTMF